MNIAGLAHTSLFERLDILIGALPLLAGILYVIRPTERRLAIMRPLSLAGIFASVSNLLLGAANGLHALGRSGEGGPGDYAHAGPILAEAIIPSFVGFACLTVAWLCVAVAIRRSA